MSEQTLSRQDERIHPPVGLFPAMLALGAGGLMHRNGRVCAHEPPAGSCAGTGVSIPAAGGYISAYAAGVVVGAPCDRGTARQARKTFC